MSLLPKSISLRLEVPGRQQQQQKDEKSTGTPTKSGSDGSPSRTSESSSPSSSNSNSPKVKEKEAEYFDIELEELPVPLAGTLSTDNLVRAPSSCSQLPEYLPPTITTDDDKTKSPSDIPIPDYKSQSLRWPFIVFLLVLIAGFFAFLEYQIHDLPPPRYSMIKIDDPEPQARIPIASPEPDPRPPEEAYPKPPGLIDTKCGWEPPSWKITHVEDPACDGFTCNEFPELCENGDRNTNLTCVRSIMEEYIETFTTDDPSWCPCQMYYVWDGWGNGGNIMEPDWTYDSPDPGCSSVMLAIQSFNHYKTTVLGTDKTVLPREGEELTELLFRTETLSGPPPLPTTGYWPYPSLREEDGALMLPLVTRTAGLEVKDVFGNRVSPGESALFPDRFYSRMYPGDVWIPAGCWLENVWHVDQWKGKGLPATCSETSFTSWETVWWALPLTRPGVTKSSQGPGSGITTAPAMGGEITTTVRWDGGSPSTPTAEPGIQTSFLLQPICTSCSSETGGGTQPPKETGTSASSSTTTSTSTAEGVKSTAVSTTAEEAEPITTTKEEEDGQTALPIVVGGTSTSSTSTTPGQKPVPSDTQTSERRPVTNDPALGLSSQPSPTPTQPPQSQSQSQSQSALPIVGGVIISISPDNQTTQEPPDGKPSPRPTRPQGPISPSSQSTLHNLRSELSYLMASVIPVLLATLLSIPIQVFTSSLCRTFPFRALTATNNNNNTDGAPAKDTLLLPLSGGGNGNPLEPVLVSYRFIARYGDPLPLISVLLSLLAGVFLVPISSEVIRLEFTKNCNMTSYTGNTGVVDGPTFADNLFGGGMGNARLCAFGVRKAGELIRVAEGILIVLAVLIICSWWVLRRWRSGVGSEPWCVAGMVALLGSERGGGNEIAGLLRTLPNRSSDTRTGVDGKEKKKKEREEMMDIDVKMEQLFEGKRFRLGYSVPKRTNDPREMEYGLQIITPPTEPIKDDDKSIKLTVHDPPTRQPTTSTTSKIWGGLKRALVCKNAEFCLRITALIFTTGLLILILYYECTVGPDTAFEAFMNSQGFGVRILFTAFGTVITTYWSYYFAYISEPQIHHQLAASAPFTPSPPPSHAITPSEKGPIESNILPPRRKPGQPAHTTILQTPPFNIFTGIYRSFPSSKRFSRIRNVDNNDLYPEGKVKGQTLTFHISMATLLAKFTPILLSNIPFSNAVTWKIHEACTWLSVAFLSYMVLVLVFSLVLPYKEVFVVKMREFWLWRTGSLTGQHEDMELKKKKRGDVYMPVKVDTIAGHMYYLCHSGGMFRDFEGLLEVNSKERDRLVCGMGRRYFFGGISVVCSCSGTDSGSGSPGTGSGGTSTVNGWGLQVPGKEKKHIRASLGMVHVEDDAGCSMDDTCRHEKKGCDGDKTVIGVGYC